MANDELRNACAYIESKFRSALGPIIGSKSISVSFDDDSETWYVDVGPMTFVFQVSSDDDQYVFTYTRADVRIVVAFELQP